MNKLDTGMIITIAAFFAFYLYIAFLRGRKKRLQREEILSVQKKGKNAKIPDFSRRPIYEVRSWWIVGAAMVLMLGGLMARYSSFFPAAAQQYWWVAVTIGVLALAAGIK